MEKYRPSNGSEGSWFTGKFCENCRYELFMHTQNDKDPMCEILTRSLINDYVDEWIYDKDGNPTCTKFRFHEWFDQDDFLIEPPEIYDNPNQLDLFKDKA